MILQSNGKPGIGRALGNITQVGTADPIFTPILNTMGEVFVNRLTPGQYLIQIGELPFKAGATRINGAIDGTQPTLLSLAAINDYFVQYAYISEGTLSMDVKNAAGTRVELSSLAGGNLTLSCDIQVYNQYEVPNT